MAISSLWMQLCHGMEAVYLRALRFIAGERFSTHHCALYQKVGCPSLTSSKSMHCTLFVYKALVHKLPSHLTSLLASRLRSYQTRSQWWITLEIPSISTELGKSAFSFIAPCGIISQIGWFGTNIGPLRTNAYVQWRPTQSNPNPDNAGPIVRCPMGLPLNIGPGIEPGSVVTPLALRCSALDHCATQEGVLRQLIEDLCTAECVLFSMIEFFLSLFCFS
jgi:hypothetical protein